MRDYELVVLLPVNEHAEAVLSAVQKTVEQNDGKLVKTDKWGEKALAYPVKKQSQALYFLLNISATPENAQGIDRTLRVNETLLRYLLVRKEEGKRQKANRLQTTAIEEETEVSDKKKKGSSRSTVDRKPKNGGEKKSKK